MVDLSGEYIQPNPRPTSLKNQSIDIVKSFADPKRFTRTVHDTLKGSVAHLTPLPENVWNVDESAIPAAIVYPKYEQGVDSSLTELSKGESFLQMAEHSFNYAILGQKGFEGLGRLHDKVDCYNFHYDGDIRQAIETMNTLV